MYKPRLKPKEDILVGTVGSFTIHSTQSGPYAPECPYKVALVYKDINIIIVYITLYGSLDYTWSSVVVMTR